MRCAVFHVCGVLFGVFSVGVLLPVILMSRLNLLGLCNLQPSLGKQHMQCLCTAGLGYAIYDAQAEVQTPSHKCFLQRYQQHPPGQLGPHEALYISCLLDGVVS